MIVNATIVLGIFFASPASAAQTLPLVTRDGMTLSGVIERPASALKAIALLLPGSGNVGLDGDVSSPFVGTGYQGQKAALSEQLAQTLAEKGVATFRYAKRGFETPSELPHQTFDYLLRDAEDALAMLRTREAGVPVYVVGFSEGALLAVHLAARVPVDKLFLLALPTRPIDELLDYQFMEWPVGLVSTRLDLNRDGIVDPSEQPEGAVYPIAGAPLLAADANGDHSLSLSEEVVPFFRTVYQQIRGMLADPNLLAWYNAMKALPSFDSIATQVSAPVYLYQGTADPQVNSQWPLVDSRFFSGLKGLRLFSGLGHGFAPLQGLFGEAKTSGPFSSVLLDSLAEDI